MTSRSMLCALLSIAELLTLMDGDHSQLSQIKLSNNLSNYRPRKQGQTVHHHSDVPKLGLACTVQTYVCTWVCKLLQVICSIIAAHQFHTTFGLKKKIATEIIKSNKKKNI